MWFHLSHIYLKNFQSIKGPVQIDFAPLTLLYGPNSAGKSAVFDAIQIAGDLCNEEDIDVEDKLCSFMHMHDFSEKMVIGVGAPLDFARLYSPKALGSFNILDFLPWFGPFLNEGEELDWCWEVRFIIEFRYPSSAHSAGADKPYAGVEAVEIFEYGKKLVRLDLNKSSIEIDLSHRLVQTINRHLAPGGQTFQGLCAEVIDDSCLVRNDSLLCIINSEFDLDLTRIPPDHLWRYDDHPYSEEKVHSQSRQELEILLQYLIFFPIRDVGYVARRVERIGPLRLIPKHEQLQFFLSLVAKYEDHERWSAVPIDGRERNWMNGSAAWTMLAANPQVRVAKGDRVNGEFTANRRLLDAVNDWLSSPQRLGLGSSIEIAVREILGGGLPGKQEQFSWSGQRTSAETMQKISVIRVRNQNLGVFAAVEDVGAGVAQIVPILVAGFESVQTAVEQPELHLHPQLQVQVADFFLSTWNLRLHRSIIETHSEYLALRLLRRIRETSKADIRHREFSLDNGDVAFYYFNPIEGETKVTKLRVSPDGEFIDRWPKGFFAEREAELFDEDD